MIFRYGRRRSPLPMAALLSVSATTPSRPGASRDFQILDPAFKADYDRLQKVRDADISNVSRDLADDRWVVAFEGDDAPIYCYLYDRATKKASVLFSNRPDLETYKLSKVKPIEYKARDGMLIYGYLTTPAGVEAKRLPMVVFPHGGPWGRDLWGYDPYAQWLANRGYAVLQPNCRASTGYGKKYLNAEIGRASCRERGKISVIDGAVKR